jgi:hypothetical protein
MTSCSRHTILEPAQTLGLAVNGDDAATCDADLERWLDKIGLL